MARDVVRVVRRAVASLAGLALPVDCAGCGWPDQSLCPSCRAALAGQSGRIQVRPSPVGVSAFAAVGYGGAVARIVVAWKERGRHDLARPLAGALAVALGGLLDHLDSDHRAGAATGEPVLVVPVPSSRSARRRRGEDTVLRLARLAAGQVRRTRRGGGPGRPHDGSAPAGRRTRRGGDPTSAPVGARGGGRLQVLPALGLVRAVADQSGLSAPARRDNLREALRVRPVAVATVRGRICVVVDDVLTTGATLTEAIRALEAAGAQVAGVATVCVTGLRHRCDSPSEGVPVQVTKH